MLVRMPATDGSTHTAPSAFCPVFQAAAELIGRRWTAAIVRSLLGGRLRFSDILGAIPGLSDRLLTERLRELEAEGIVVRAVIPESPVRVEYGLTAKGLELEHIVVAIDAWAGAWAGTGHQPAAACPASVASGR